jgi:hypothetical protein
MEFTNRPARKQGQVVIDPIEIFRRLPKPPNINDLYVSQGDVLKEWFDRRTEKDIVLKLHTGGGKTLVGLLIGTSIMSETRKPVVYVVPTKQLVDQALGKAAEYGLAAVAYPKSGTDFPAEFHDARAVMVCTYHALFNGRCRFGTSDGSQTLVPLGGIILDDAHVAFGAVRDQFTLSVERKPKDAPGDNVSEEYATLTSLFRSDFEKLGRVGSFDDIVNDSGDFGVLEVPYWAWKEKSAQVREHLRTHTTNRELVWLFLRDAFDQCHALISSKAFVITPILPLVHLAPAFEQCPRRIFMSATISDDSAIVRTFDASAESVKKPILSRSLAGVSERMILVPELMPSMDSGNVARGTVKWASGTAKMGAVILTPSERTAGQWSDTATFAKADDVNDAVKSLIERKSNGPFVFANRYDGIDLPGDACRALVLAGLPRGSGEYELFRAAVLSSGSAINATIGQRIEQGMGRAARGPHDWCVIILAGKDLTGWISRESNQAFLTTSTRAQLQMGVEISRDVKDGKDLSTRRRSRSWRRRPVRARARPLPSRDGSCSWPRVRPSTGDRRSAPTICSARPLARTACCCGQRSPQRTPRLRCPAHRPSAWWRKSPTTHSGGAFSPISTRWSRIWCRARHPISSSRRLPTLAGFWVF